MKNVRLSASLSLLIVVCLVLMSSCEKEITSIRLTSRERIRIDTIAKQKIDSLIPVMDSICIANYEELRDKALDSILTIRKEEELKIRSRIKR
jgi:hypothetical protein